MEVSLTPQEESLLAELSARTGRPAEQIVREAVDAFLEHER
jgi:predicted DNA-binding protein